MDCHPATATRHFYSPFHFYFLRLTSTVGEHRFRLCFTVWASHPPCDPPPSPSSSPPSSFPYPPQSSPLSPITRYSFRSSWSLHVLPSNSQERQNGDVSKYSRQCFWSLKCSISIYYLSFLLSVAYEKFKMASVVVF